MKPGRPAEHRRGERGPAPAPPGARSPSAGRSRAKRGLARYASPIAWALAASWTALYSYLSLRKLDFYLYRDFDLAIFAQAADGIFAGSFFSSIRGMGWLGDHSSLILFALAPFTLLAPATIVLLIAQSAALGAGAVAVERIARRELGTATGSLAFALAYLLQPALGYLNLYEFHPEAIATAALLWTWDAMRGGHPGRTMLFAAIALACKEDVAPVVLVLAAVAWWYQRPVGARFAWRLAGLAALSGAVTFLMLKPAFDPGLVDYGRLYSEWGATPGEQIRAMLADPPRALAHLVSTPGDLADTARKRDLLFQLLVPFGFASLLAPIALLPALPALAAHFLSHRAEQHMIVFQYTAMLVPFVTVAAVHGVGTVSRRLGGARAGTVAAFLALGVLAAAGASQRAFGPFVQDGLPSEQRMAHRLQPTAMDRALAPHRDQMVARVGDREGIVAGFELLTRFASRRRVHSAHHVLGGFYTFSNRPYPPPHDVEAVLLDAGSVELVREMDLETARRWADLVADNRLRPVDAAGDLTLWLRDAPDSIALVAPDSIVPGRGVSHAVLGAELEWLGSESESRVRDGLLPVVSRWRRLGPSLGLVQMDLALLDSNNRSVVGRSRLLGYGLAPPSSWTPDVVMCERYAMVVPRGTPSGRYTLAMRLRSREGGRVRPLDPAGGAGPDGWLGISTVDVP